MAEKQKYKFTKDGFFMGAHYRQGQEIELFEAQAADSMKPYGDLLEPAKKTAAKPKAQAKPQENDDK